MLEAELNAAIGAAKSAQGAILDVYHSSFDVEIKDDDSPVTKADKLADAIIRDHLSALFPEDAFLTEESADTPARLSAKRVWIVDPVDGTKEFVSRTDEFTTNIALCVDHEIVLGVINLPVIGIVYYAIKGVGAFRKDVDGTITRLHVDERTENLRCMRSVSFFRERENAYLNKHRAHFDEKILPIGSSIKFCALAEGRADFFIRLSSRTKEWDVAPGDLLLSEAGGFMIEPSGKPFTYNRQDVYNRDGYLMGNKLQPWMLELPL